MLLARLQVSALVTFSEARIVRLDPAASARRANCDFEPVELGPLLTVAHLATMLRNLTLLARGEWCAHIDR